MAYIRPPLSGREGGRREGWWYNRRSIALYSIAAYTQDARPSESTPPNQENRRNQDPKTNSPPAHIRKFHTICDASTTAHCS
jgi:hypothetical protein